MFVTKFLPLNSLVCKLEITRTMLAAHVLVEVINLVPRLELLLEKTLEFDRRGVALYSG